MGVYRYRVTVKDYGKPVYTKRWFHWKKNDYEGVKKAVEALGCRVFDVQLEARVH